ncbi:MAG: hypothetical protein J6D00_03610 [Christensenellaceae bacterium]|nr:hypothetical protein [Christensenellaceae bacterium]
MTAAKNRLNGSMGYLQINGEDWGEVSEVKLKIELEYKDIRRGLDIDKKMTGRRGKGVLTLKRAYSRAAEILDRIKEGTEPSYRLVTWIADPDAYGRQEERIAIDSIKFSNIDLFGFTHGDVVSDSYEFFFVPGDIVYLDRIEA